MPRLENTACGAILGGSPSSSPASGFSYPKIGTAVTMPAVDSTVQTTVTGASNWAVPGLVVWIPGHNGYATITGVSGDLITLKNITVEVGTVLAVGTVLVIGPPAIQATDDEIGTSAILSSINGVFDGVPKSLSFTLGKMLHGGATGWQAITASPFIPTPTKPELLVVKRDVLTTPAGVTVTNAAQKWAAPTLGAPATSAFAPATVTFPQFPTVPAGSQIVAEVECTWKFAALSASTLTIETTINGVTNITQAYCPAIADVLAVLPAAIRHKGAAGTFRIRIPVPDDNAPVNVSIYANKSDLTAPSVSNSHFIMTYRVLGYYF